MAEFLAGMAENPDLGPEDRETFARNSVRAAYYACYHNALKWAKVRGYKKPNSWASHEGLWSCWFKQESATDDIHQAGLALMAKRVEADYYVDETFPHDPRAVLEEADEFLDFLQADVQRVGALPIAQRTVTWDVKAHKKPGRASTRKGGAKSQAKTGS